MAVHHLRAIVPVCILLFASTGLANSILVNNFSFETLPAGGLPIVGYLGGVYSEDAIPGWTNGGFTGQFQPGGPSGTVPDPYFNTLSNGPTDAYSNGGTISQTVGAVVQAGVTYTFQVDIGSRLDTPALGTADLLVNGVQHFATGTLVAGGWATFTAVYTGLAADVGDSITIQLNSSGEQGDFDNVRLSNNLTTTTPEPGSFALMGSGIVGLIAWRYRRSRATQTRE
ncbi:MAG TPA: PEP-CTERM sorting domain-containing protein [Blastocatellia bacterium]